jgi:hypothetical protein
LQFCPDCPSFAKNSKSGISMSASTSFDNKM